MGNNHSQNRGNNSANNNSSHRGNPTPNLNSTTTPGAAAAPPKPKRRGTQLDLPDLTPSPADSMITQPIPIPVKDKRAEDDHQQQQQRQQQQQEQQSLPRGRPRSRDPERIRAAVRKDSEKDKIPKERADREQTAPSKGKGKEPQQPPLQDTELGAKPSYHPPLSSMPVIDSLTRYDSRDGKLRRKPPTGAERARVRPSQPFTKTVVRSSVPTGLRRIEKRSSGELKIPTLITWRNTAKQVFVTGSFLSVPWRSRIPLQVTTIPAPSSTSTIPKMIPIPPPAGGSSSQPSQQSQSQPQSPTSPTSPNATRLGKTITTHQTTIQLSPGTHRLKFLVDGVYMCSDELATASDEDGSLVNVIDVGEGLVLDAAADGAAGLFDLGGGEALHTNPHLHPADQLNPPDQYWSSDEEYTTASDDDDEESDGDDARSTRRSRRGRQRVRSLVPKKVSTWTTVVPSELEVAAKIEEEYLIASDKQQHRPRSVDQRSLSILFNGPHLLPPAPALPHFLNNVILNANYGAQPNQAQSQHAPPPSKSKRKAGTTAAVVAGGPPSPTQLPAHLNTDSPMRLVLRPNLGQGAITGDGVKQHDDSSVLPTPSHVVLNHLATGAIKGGVLACAGTVRYNKKCITTVYYKPTTSAGGGPPPPQAGSS